LLLLLLMTIGFSCTIPGNRNNRKTLFSDGWYFIRLENADTTLVRKQEVQTGRDWESQYNIERVRTERTENHLQNDWEKEFHIIRAKRWESVTLPHTAYIEPLVIKHPWQGISYYRKRFFVPVADTSHNLFLHFEGAMQEAMVWINGKKAAVHDGGYTPFEIFLNPLITCGDTNEVLVRLDNRDNPLIPPGKPSNRLDFCYYSGLYRDVYLIKTGRVYIPDPVTAGIPAGGGVFVTFPEATRKRATIRIRTTVFNELAGDVTVSVVQVLYDKNRKVKDRVIQRMNMTGKDTLVAEQRMVLEQPHLWDTDDPYLYRLETRIEKDGKYLDKVYTRIGIRRFAFTRNKGFLLNGKPVKLTGTNRHQEYPYIGNAVPDNAQYRDMVKIKEGGFNIVRLAHYPQDPAVLDACDELGLLVIDCIPGWQFFNADTLFVSRTFRDIRDMIRRDRNHPSVVLWETVLNEAWLPGWWKKKAYAIAHEEYPGDQCYTSGDMYGSFVWDVLYNDWHRDFTRPNDSKKPGFIREYGDYEFGGNQSTSRQRRGDGEQNLLQSAWNFQWSLNRYNAYYPWTNGNATWEMFDHNRGCCPTISASGASDIFRIPKFTWHFYRSQVDPGHRLAKGLMNPEVYIANYWAEGNPVRKVVVYGNVDEVELQVNGKMITRQKPDNGPDTPYFYEGENPWEGGHPFNGDNCRHLVHPPFTFTKVQWEKGKVTALGYIHGKMVARQTVLTPGPAAGLEIVTDFSHRKPVKGEKDVLFVYVKLIDENGTLCVKDDHTSVMLKATGAEILSPEKVKAEAGIATFLISTYKAPDIFLRTETNKGLKHQKRFVLEGNHE